MSIIHVDHLCKDYQVHQKEPGLAGSLRSFVRRKYQIVPAVKDVSFDIAQGECLGVVGESGSRGAAFSRVDDRGRRGGARWSDDALAQHPE